MRNTSNHAALSEEFFKVNTQIMLPSSLKSEMKILEQNKQICRVEISYRICTAVHYILVHQNSFFYQAD